MNRIMKRLLSTAATSCISQVRGGRDRGMGPLLRSIAGSLVAPMTAVALVIVVVAGVTRVSGVGVVQAAGAAAATPLVLVFSEKTSVAGETPDYDASVLAAKLWLDRYFRCDVLTASEVEQGRLAGSGYRVAILPDNAVMSDQEGKAWERFVAGGGQILAAASTSTQSAPGASASMQLGDLLGVWYKQALPAGTYQQLLIPPPPAGQSSILASAGVDRPIQVQGPAYLVDTLANGATVAVRANANGMASLIYPAAVVQSRAGLYFSLPIFNPTVLAWPDLQEMLYKVLAYLAPEAVTASFAPVPRSDLFQSFSILATSSDLLATLQDRPLGAGGAPPAARIVEQVSGEVPPAASYRLFPGAYYRKAVSSFDVWTGIEGVITLPELITDPSRQRAQGPLDNASIYMGGSGSGQEIDAGFTWDSNVNGWRPFWRNEKWHNAPLDPAQYVWYPGETVRMWVTLAGAGQLRLTLVDAGAEPKKGFSVVFPAWGFRPGGRMQFKRVNAIDQVGREGRSVEPTHARVTPAVWSEVWLWRGDVKVPFTPQRFTDMRAPSADHFVVAVPPSGGPGAEAITIYGTPSDRLAS